MNRLLSLLVPLQHEHTEASDLSLQALARHASTPQGLLGMAVVVAVFAFTVFATVYTLIYFFKPGEQDASHIKRAILQDEQ